MSDEENEPRDCTVVQSPDATSQSHYSTPVGGGASPPVSSSQSSITRGSLSNEHRTVSPQSHHSRATDISAVPIRDPRGGVADINDTLETITARRPIQYSNNTSHYSLHTDPPPPYPGLSRLVTSHGDTPSTIPRYMTEPLITRSRDVNVQRIPTITFHDEAGTQYAAQMNWSLCMLVLCLVLCNIISLFFTVPAVICSWQSVQAGMNYQHRNAERKRKIALICNWIAVAEFVILFTCFCLVLGVYLLIRNEFITVNFS